MYHVLQAQSFVLYDSLIGRLELGSFTELTKGFDNLTMSRRNCLFFLSLENQYLAIILRIGFLFV